MNDRVYIPNWYQLDFKTNSYKQTLASISNLVKELEKQKLIDKWFYLFEGKTIRVRFHSHKRAELNKTIDEIVTQFQLVVAAELPFQDYWETLDAFPTLDVAEAFANMMSELTKVSITRLSNPSQFSNYKLVERLSHCIYNNIYGAPTEEYFLLKRLLERLGSDTNGLNDDPEQTFLDNEQKITLINSTSLTIPSLRVPQK